MSDPEGPAYFSDFSAMAESDVARDQAAEVVRAVLAWYAGQVLKERRAPMPSPAHIEELTAAWEAARADQSRLAEASPEEMARLATHYAAQYRKLRDS
ncbi:hypothetical protein OG863_03575 [Streptomyces decoyicus]|uniref:Uncharacterized protein n=1 Tax=Streptomyces decoyicus TaxID=249567 RepID=A0ABZ1F9W0_9ACTN|nr:hypothetical protein [Streptomyces decoyicus]WSB67124.1 hypothetical protein OG863_03575 [Streptomyces decoyicus]